MEYLLPNEENPDIDKSAPPSFPPVTPNPYSRLSHRFAILLRPVEANPQPWLNEKRKPKMIGLVGTNRWSKEGMETGYCVNIKYWGKGYAGEAFPAFLKLFWAFPGK